AGHCSRGGRSFNYQAECPAQPDLLSPLNWTDRRGGLSWLAWLPWLGRGRAEEGFIQGRRILLLQFLDHRFQLLRAELLVDVFLHIFQRGNLALLHLDDVIAITGLDGIADLIDGEAEG